MSWQMIVKAIPPKEEIEGFLMTPQGVDRIASQFEEALAEGDKKNLRNSRKRIDDLAEGKTKGLTPEIAERVKEHAKKLQALLNPMFEGTDAQGKKPGPRTTPKVTDSKLKSALENYNKGNKEPLVDWLGENSENRVTKQRQKILRENREAIRNLPRDDDDLFYVSFRNPGEKTVYMTDSDADLGDIKEAFSGIENISFRADMEDQLDDKDKPINNQFNKLPGVAIIPPKKMSGSEYKEFNNTIERLKADKITVYKLRGKKLPSVLWSVLGDKLTPDETRAKQRFEHKGAIKYKGNVSTSQQVLAYFELLTKKGWANKPMFMPDSIISQKKDSQAMKTLIGGGHSAGWGPRVSISNHLKVVLQSSSLNPSDMAERMEREKKMIPLQLRNLIAEDGFDDNIRELIDRAGITEDELRDLRSKAQQTGPRDYIDWPKFQSKLNSSALAGLRSSFNKLQSAMEGPMENLFNEEEVDFFEGLKGKSEDEVEDAIADFYDVDEDTVLDSEVTVPTRRILRAEKIFIPVGQQYKLDTNHAHRDRDTFTRVFRTFRQKKYSVEIPVERANAAVGVPSGVISTIVDIDFYYRRGLVEEANAYNDAEPEDKAETFKKLADSINKDYAAIIDSLVEATNKKMDHIIANREDYIKAMKFKVRRGQNPRTYEILNKLKGADLIIEIGEEEE